MDLLEQVSQDFLLSFSLISNSIVSILLMYYDEKGKCNTSQAFVRVRCHFQLNATDPNALSFSYLVFLMTWKRNTFVSSKWWPKNPELNEMTEIISVKKKKRP